MVRAGIYVIAEPFRRFDGRLSLAELGGFSFLYARANLHRKSGGRYVQVARSRAAGGDGTWDRFAPLEIAEYPWARVARGNAYFAAVGANPADAATLLALAPVNDGRSAFLGLALSCDGARFSRLEAVLRSAAAPLGRTTDHPVDGWRATGAGAEFYVHRDVPGIAPAGADSRIVAFLVPAPVLANYTARARASLGAACAPPGAWPPPRQAGPRWLWEPGNRPRT